jgi:hypothetical protein
MRDAIKVSLYFAIQKMKRSIKQHINLPLGFGQACSEKAQINKYEKAVLINQSMMA